MTLLRKLFCHKFSYQKAFSQALTNPIQYWKKQAKKVKWKTFPKTMLSVDNLHFHRWFPDGQINITQQCLDVHLSDRSHLNAYMIQSPITNTTATITYGQLHRRVQHFSGTLIHNFNILPGDRIIIYMPMVIESVIAMLACARVGATHVVVFGGFAAHQLANRIVDCQPKLIICANAGKQPNKIINYLQIVDNALQISKQKHLNKIIFQRWLIQPQPLKLNEYDFLEAQNGGPRTPPIYVPSSHPLYILYTSGTTGKPKGIIRDHGGTAVILHHAMRIIYNSIPGQSMFCSSDIGWVLGHSFIVYAPLIAGMKSVLFQGKPVGTPTADVFWQIVDKHKSIQFILFLVDHFNTSPTAIRTIRKQDSEGELIKQYDLTKLKSVTLVGQRCDIPTFNWVQQHLGRQMINDCYWQTQSGSPILSNYMGYKTFPAKPGSACKPLPGYNVQVINSQTSVPCAPFQQGTIFLKQPLPPSFMLTILNHDDKYIQKYFSTVVGHYNTGDSGYYDQDGYFYVMSREDDVINTAGHRLSTGQMQQILMKHELIAEAIVIGVSDQIKGQIPVAFVTIKTKYLHTHIPLHVSRESVELVRTYIGPVASFKLCYIVPRIPKTRSGKYLRSIVRKMYNRETYQMPSTVQDIDVLHQIEAFIRDIQKRQLQK